MNGAGVLLILLAIGLFAAEVKVASYGLLTVGGLVAMILGAMMLVDSPLPELRVDPWTLAAGDPGLRASSRSRWCGWCCRRSGARRRPGAEGLVGAARPGRDRPRARGLGDRAGRALAARGRSEPVAAHDPVVVESVEGLVLRVRKGA